MIDLLPPDFHGTDSEKLLQLTNYTWLLYDALSRKMENIDTQDLTPSLARIIIMLQNYFNQYNFSNTQTVNFNDNSLLLSFLNESFLNINKNTENNYYYAIKANANAGSKSETSQGTCTVTALRQGDLLVYSGHVEMTSTSFTINLMYPYESTPTVYTTRRSFVPFPQFGQAADTPGEVGYTQGLNQVTFTSSDAGEFDFYIMGIVVEGTEFIEDYTRPGA